MGRGRGPARGSASPAARANCWAPGPARRGGRGPEEAPGRARPLREGDPESGAQLRRARLAACGCPAAIFPPEPSASPRGGGGNPCALGRLPPAARAHAPPRDLSAVVSPRLTGTGDSPADTHPTRPAGCWGPAPRCGPRARGALPLCARGTRPRSHHAPAPQTEDRIRTGFAASAEKKPFLSAVHSCKSAGLFP